LISSLYHYTLEISLGMEKRMAAYTSSQFASAAAAGEDWREVCQIVLKELESVGIPEQGFNIGFLYLSDRLAPDATSILELFRSVLNIDNWLGTVGVGVCGCGESHIDKPALSVLVGRLNPEDFCLFSGKSAAPGAVPETLAAWTEKKDPLLIFVHGDSLAQQDPGLVLKVMEQATGGFYVGGFASSRKEHIHFAGGFSKAGISGIAFSQNVKVATTLSQACTPIGDVHTITRGNEHVIRELNSRKATDVFEDDIRALAISRIGRNPDTILVDEEVIKRPDSAPEEFKGLLKGEVHAAFPVSESDQRDYLVRNIVGIDPEEGAIAVSQNISPGERVMFVRRDDETLRQDLSRSLLEIRARVQKENGIFAPRAALYVSCMARAYAGEAGNGEDEMKLVQEIIGDVPLAGFYAGGEICNARIYGYTGILTLFL
jgi:small ligand-binding sensory domain FIST